MYLTKRQQQVLRRLLLGNTKYVPSIGWDLPFSHTDVSQMQTTGDWPWTSLNTLHTLADAELVGDFLDADGTLCYALTAKGRLLAGLLGGGEVAK